jgi:uncharacterized phage-like protein YoqJ
MKSCAFFGHRDWGLKEGKEEIKNSIVNLIEKYGVMQFYCGGRGNFDNLCSQIVYELKKKYPHIKNTLVLSYIPKRKEEYGLPAKYDDSVYFLEERVPPRYAIVKTNEKMIDKSDYVIVGVRKSWGGAYRAGEYAKRKGKVIIQIQIKS